MQTFLPYADFRRCAVVLDYRRLGKQRVEAMQILNCLDQLRQGIRKGWANHPAVRMWVGYETLLGHYMNVMIEEWVHRGYNNTMKKAPVNSKLIELNPEWMGDERLHSSHRANLIRKLPDYYSRYGWAEKPQEGYWWPYRRVNGKWECYIY